MKKALAGIGVTLLVTVLLFGQHITGYTTVFSEWVLNSLIDNTPIGSHTPSSGAFTTSSASGGFAGNLTGNASTATTLAADPSFTCTPGSYPAGIVANGNATNCQNSITGNSATTTQLAAAGSNCGSTIPAYGIDANGNALCTTPSASILTQGLTISSGACTASGAETYCSITNQSWPVAFVDSNYFTTCSFTGIPTGTGSHPGMYGPYTIAQTASQISVEVQAGSGSAGGNITSPLIRCIGFHP